MLDIYRAGFTYTVEQLAPDGSVKSSETYHNIIPTAGLDHILGVTFKGASAFSNWYVSLYEANRTPLAADTMTTFLADCVENTTYTTTGGARQSITFPAVADGALIVAPPYNEFEFAASATIRGAFITTNVTRGSSSGLLMSAVLFPVAKTPGPDEPLRVKIGFSLTSV